MARISCSLDARNYQRLKILWTDLGNIPYFGLIFANFGHFGPIRQFLRTIMDIFGQILFKFGDFTDVSQDAGKSRIFSRSDKRTQ